MKAIIKYLILGTIFSTAANEAPITKVDSLTFYVKTNMAGFSFEGKLQEPTQIKTTEGKQTFSIDPSNLTTEMSLRDEHMRDQIFKNSPISFIGQKKCAPECTVEGTLTIAKKSKKVTLPLTKDGDKYLLKHKIDLKDFEIEQPQFMGVKVENNVEINATLN